MAADKQVTNYTKEELALVLVAIERELDSAQRQQNIKGRTPMMQEVFNKHEKIVQALRDKVQTHYYNV